VQDELQNERIDLIINTTPVGMYPNQDYSPVDKELLYEGQTVFDIVYNPVDTKLLREAREVGANIISGLDMFIAQGIRQIELWQEVEIDPDKYYQNLRDILINNLKPNP